MRKINKTKGLSTRRRFLFYGRARLNWPRNETPQLPIANEGSLRRRRGRGRAVKRRGRVPDRMAESAKNSPFFFSAPVQPNQRATFAECRATSSPSTPAITSDASQLIERRGGKRDGGGMRGKWLFGVKRLWFASLSFTQAPETARIRL